ncbi:MAG TPA: DUF1045 domain-containing protein [Candidatus Elarobacter sp.]
MTRYAIYFAPPPGSPLRAFGEAWFAGRYPGGVSDERLREIVAAPRTYGFHATLKPPFALAAGATVDALQAGFEAFAERQAAFAVEGLQLAEIGGFLALTLRDPSEHFAQLAEAAVRAFEPFRAPSSAEDLARRSNGRLNARERELLETWGYPYVLDTWRFHMTLTQRLDDEERALVHAALAPLVAPLVAEPLRIDAVSLFAQTAGAPFAEIARAPFAAPATVASGAAR